MRLISGSWSATLADDCRVATRTWWVGALAFVPVLVGLSLLYPWVDAPAASGAKAFWLTPAAYTVVTVAWFGALATWGRWMREAGSAAAAATGLVLLPILGSLCAWLWLMSLDPALASSGFGLQVYCIEVTIALCALLLRRLSRPEPVEAPRTMGALLLTLLLLWGYFKFLGFFITWSGNLPDGAGWYLERSDGVWLAWTWACSLLNAVPIVALLVAPVRQSPRMLALLAWPVLIGQVGELGWLVLPGFGPGALPVFLLASLGFSALFAAQVSGWAVQPAAAQSAPA